MAQTDLNSYPRPFEALPPFVRVSAAGLTLILGLLPSAAFFVWIERNAALPILPIEFAWPWIASGNFSTFSAAAFDLLLILIFGVLHTGLAQAKAQIAFRKWLKPHLIRSFYVIITGLSLFAIMGFWQHTGIILWNLQLHPDHLLRSAISAILYWSLMFLALKQAMRMDLWHFVGLRQLYSYAKDVGTPQGSSRLITSGLYARVRHPIYTLTLLAIVLTPFMTLDRMLIFVGTSIYLAFAVPLEEKKLVREFGSAYMDYQKDVPAVIPRLGYTK